MPKKTDLRLHCAKCGHRWFRNVLKPKKCPRCQTREWSGQK